MGQSNDKIARRKGDSSNSAEERGDGFKAYRILGLSISGLSRDIIEAARRASLVSCQY